MGVVMIGGVDVSHLTRRVEIVAEAGKPLLVSFQVIGADLFANVESEHIAVSEASS